jgi:hypothetical protein
MRRIEINNGDNPLGKFGDGDFNPNCYPDAVFMVNNLLEVIQVFVRELACSSKDGTITIDKIGNRMGVLAPDDPTAGYEIGEIGHRVCEAEKAVRDAERDAVLDTSGRNLGGGADQTDFDFARAKAGFSALPVWIGGPGPSEPYDIYWTEADRGITHDMLMDACDGISAEYRRLIHRNVGSLASLRHRRPTVTDLYNALLIYRTHARLAPHDGSPLESAYPSSCGRSWDEAGSPVTRDAALAELQRLGQEFDAAPCDPGCTHAPIRTEPVGWTTKPQVSNGLLAPGVWTGDNSGQTGTGDGYYINHHVDRTPQDPKDGPNAVEPSLSADECETVSSASPAAPGGNPEDWRWVNPPEGELKSDIVEMEREIQALAEAHNLPRRMIAGDIGNNAEADEFFSGIRGSGCPESDPEVTPDGIEIHHPAKCTGPMHLQADLSRDVWDIRASASVEAGGRFPAVDISAPIKD